MISTLKRPLKVRTFYSSENAIQPLEEKSKDEAGKAYKVVFVPSPQSLTPLKTYEAQLRKAGYSDELIRDIIDGLADSPLYESKTS